MVAQTVSFSTCELEACLEQVPGHPQQQSETPSQNQNQNHSFGPEDEDGSIVKEVCYQV